MRPKIMEEVEGLRGINSLNIKEAHEAGRKVVGMYCIFSPQEISLAADAISVTLCGTTQAPVGDAERELPR
ncbi:MAG: 2-hydroxyacyl-CoA dehydratase, partial [Natronincolaceae bacterium]